MSPKVHLAYNALWCAHPVLFAAVVAIMVRRKLHRAYPYFFSYAVFQIVAFALTYPFHDDRFYEMLFRIYWATTAVSVVLGFTIIHEVFLDVFRPYHTLRDLGSVLFKWAGLVMLMVAAVMAASLRAGGDDPWWVSGILTLQRSVRVVQCGLVAFLLVFSRYLGISWRQKSFGIALGFGTLAGVELSLVVLKAPTIPTSFVNMIAYNLSIVAWLSYMFLKSPAREQAAYMLRPQRWEQSLNEIQHPGAADSLIPMFEGMVDRALSRTNGGPVVAPLPGKIAVGENSPSRPTFIYPPIPQRVASKT